MGEEFPLRVNGDFIVDRRGEVVFRVYRSKDGKLPEKFMTWVVQELNRAEVESKVAEDASKS